MLLLDDVRLVHNPGRPDAVQALAGVSLEASAGEFVTVVGSNGAGKSSLVNVVAGTMRPTSGRVLLGGRDVTRMPDYRRAGLVARVFDDPRAGTAPELSIADNLALAASRGSRRRLRFALTSSRRALLRDRVAELGLGLENRLHDQVGLLSAGQRQSLTMVMASLVRPAVLLLDEHVSALDPATATRVLRLTADLTTAMRCVTIMVTHNMDYALALGERLLVMSSGTVVHDIRSAEKRTLTAEAVVALITGSERATGDRTPRREVGPAPGEDPTSGSPTSGGSMTADTDRRDAGQSPGADPRRDLLTMWASEQRYATLTEIAEAARQSLDAGVLGFLDGGAGDELTLRRNRQAFADWAFRPRLMSGRPVPSTGTTFLGIPLSLPVLTAPFGGDRLFHPDGHVAVARANTAEGVAGIVPQIGSFSLEQLADAAPAAARIAQLHPMGPPEHFAAMLGRIERAGYQAVCVTVDAPAGGWRDRTLRSRFNPDLSVGMGNYPPDGGFTVEEVFGPFFTRDQPTWGWSQLTELMAETSLPWIAKGILTGEDAEAAAAAGASAVLVSNHGGRQLDGVPAALEQLPEVARAVGSQLEIGFDSGIRRGSDVVTAIALGADVVVLGRLAVYGLVAGGEQGVRRVLQLLREEIVTVLTLLGRGGISELDRTALQEAR